MTGEIGEAAVRFVWLIEVNFERLLHMFSNMILHEYLYLPIYRNVSIMTN
ncbi:hypothetical protein EMIT07CA2_10409 [Brevibacillus sp. IT-7CA2]